MPHWWIAPTAAVRFQWARRFIGVQPQSLLLSSKASENRRAGDTCGEPRRRAPDYDHGVTELVSLADVRAAAAELEAVVRHTPLEPARDPALPGVFLKCENLQRAGSFKIRGAYMRVKNLSGEQRARGVV